MRDALANFSIKQATRPFTDRQAMAAAQGGAQMAEGELGMVGNALKLKEGQLSPAGQEEFFRSIGQRIFSFNSI